MDRIWLVDRFSQQLQPTPLHNMICISREHRINFEEFEKANNLINGKKMTWLFCGYSQAADFLCETVDAVGESGQLILELAHLEMDCVILSLSEIVFAEKLSPHCIRPRGLL